MLDLRNRELGYNLGRLFAILEINNPQLCDSVQKNNAVTQPETAYTLMMNNYMKGTERKFDNVVFQIINNIPEFPKHTLTLKQQIQWHYGYQHQTAIVNTQPTGTNELKDRNSRLLNHKN